MLLIFKNKKNIILNYKINSFIDILLDLILSKKNYNKIKNKMEYDDVNEPLMIHDKEDNFADIDQEIKYSMRKGFISKVFGIVGYQMIILFVFVFIAYSFPSFRSLLLTSRFYFYLFLIISLLFLLIPIFKPDTFRKVPLNYFILTLFTLSYSWCIAAIVVGYTKQSVLYALFLTAITVFSLACYAITTKKDFTIYGGTLFAALIIFIIGTTIFYFIDIRLYVMIEIYVGLILFSMYLIYDIQLIVGNRSNEFKEDDYILAAINLYIDIIAIFLRILAITGKK